MSNVRSVKELGTYDDLAMTHDRYTFSVQIERQCALGSVRGCGLCLH